ncbi:MAG: HAMP domain-containing histidine kinase [Lachnospiraceae bacterium]|nr:HAMP domain-containing histidine kinase [Lachnospiraceae bacterium]
MWNRKKKRAEKQQKSVAGQKAIYKNDIAIRIYASFVFVLTVTLVLTGIIFTRLYQKNYIRSYTELLTKQGKKISRRVARFHYNGNLKQYEKYSVYVDELEGAEQTDVWIVSNGNGENCLEEEYTNASLGDDAMTAEMNKVLQGAFAGQVTASSSYDKAYGMMILRVAVPIRDIQTEEVIGGIMMVSMIDKQTMGLQEGKYLITLSAIIAVLISFILAIAFARYLSRPLNKIERDIYRISQGDYLPIEKKSRSRQLAALEERLDALSAQLAKAEEEREGLEQVRKDFFANVSHELRTPITVMRGYAESLSDGVIEGEDNIQEIYRRILTECQGMERLVGDLFVLSKMQNPDFQIDKEPVSITQIFSDVVRSARVVAQSKQVEIKLQAPEEQPCLILGDYVRLRQMFMIILDNAVKFSHEGGAIEITVAEEQEQIQVEIRDHGVGIKEEELPYIFEKFYKSKLKQNEKGTGLGLMIARQIALRHDSDIQVESKEGQGTAFVFTFAELTDTTQFE